MNEYQGMILCFSTRSEFRIEKQAVITIIYAALTVFMQIFTVV